MPLARVGAHEGWSNDWDKKGKCDPRPVVGPSAGKELGRQKAHLRAQARKTGC